MKSISHVMGYLFLFSLGISALAMPAISTAVELDSSDTAKPDYERAKMGIERKYQADKKRCAGMQGNQKDVCLEKAESTARINQQSLDAKNNIARHIDTADAKTQAQYDLDKVRCQDMSGNSKEICLQKAKTDYEKTEANIDLSKNSLDDSQQAAEEKVEADYALALKQCDRLSASKKEKCQDKAKEKYRQN